MTARSSVLEASHALFLLLLGAPTGDHPVSFDRDVRPVLSDNCFECHGPDTNKRKAKLRLDREEGLFSLRDSHPVIAPGKPDERELYARISDPDPDFDGSHTLQKDEVLNLLLVKLQMVLHVFIWDWKIILLWAI